MTVYPLHDENSNYYADAEVVSAATAAKLDSTEGDVMMYESQSIIDYVERTYGAHLEEKKKPRILFSRGGAVCTPS